jgi:hypothetical protein
LLVSTWQRARRYRQQKDKEYAEYARGNSYVTNRMRGEEDWRLRVTVGGKNKSDAKGIRVWKR